MWEPGVNAGSSAPSGSTSSKLRMPWASSAMAATCSRRHISGRKAAPMSDAVALVGRRVEEFFHRHQARREALRMMVAHEGFQCLAGGSDAVGPEVVPHRVTRGPQLLFHERQGHL